MLGYLMAMRWSFDGEKGREQMPCLWAAVPLAQPRGGRKRELHV
jgi:hypothetical protein